MCEPHKMPKVSILGNFHIINHRMKGQIEKSRELLASAPRSVAIYFNISVKIQPRRIFGQEMK